MSRPDGLSDEEAEFVGRLGSYADLADGLEQDADHIRTWWARNNYRIRELACRADLRPPLFLVSHAVAVLKERITLKSKTEEA